ncbi:hypothetical protein TrRE_jg3222 [Triparma retinervis]|uniref:Uncharacterized protein n=1 Tax=Triparma retinervis TaxID=2557542 RepID=A0A9W7DQ08_9STRA|nr:hypothetical protein TrRE_jg3222 [Triparma retinervis]
MESETAQQSQTPQESQSTGDEISSSSNSNNIKGKVIGAKKALENVGVLPTIHPVPWSTFIVLLFFVSVPPVGFAYFFSSMGKGEEFIADHDEGRETRASLCSMGVMGSGLLLYLMDFSSWKSPMARSIRAFALFAIAIMTSVYIIAVAKTMPHGLILLFSLGTVCWFTAMKHMFYYKVVFREYVSWIAGPMFAASFITLLSWIYWVSLSEENKWDDITKVRYAKTFKWDETLTMSSYTDRKLERVRIVGG